MSTEKSNPNQEIEDQNQDDTTAMSMNDIFMHNEDEDDEGFDPDEFDGVATDNEDTTAEEENQEQEEEEEEENIEDLFKDDKEKSDKSSNDDLQAFNQKYGTEFKSDQELRDYLSGKTDKEKSNEKDDQDLIQEQDNIISTFEPMLKLSHKDLMREELKAIASQEKKDLNDEDVMEEIEDKLLEMEENGTLDLRADKVRNSLTQNVINPAKEKKGTIEKKINDAKQARIEENKKSVKDALVKFAKAKSFYGLKTDKETLQKVFKEVDSGDFIKMIQENPAVQAELAMMHQYKELLYKKASGLTYNDGLKAVVDEFKNHKKENDTTIAGAQRRGSSAGADAETALVAGLVK